MGLEQLVVGALYQIFASRSAGPEQVMIEKEGSGRIFSIASVKPRGLIVLPHVPELVDVVVTRRPRKPSAARLQVWVKAGEAEHGYRLSPPARDAPETAEAGENAAEAAEVGENAPEAAEVGESPPMRDLFWKIYEWEKGADDAGPRGGLTVLEAEMTVPASCAQLKDIALRAGKKAGGAITVWVPCLTNLGDLIRGDQ